jgi:gliding motility-associated-like protein
MILRSLFYCIFFCISSYSTLFSQTFVFAQLTGNPNLNTTGWNLTGNAYVGDTQGDTDANPNELILTNASGNQSGGVFFSTPINPSICPKWTVEFDYRIWGGSAADGLAFSFLDVPPAGFVNGGGVGIPGTSNGLKVVLDTWDNGCGANPEVQIFSGVGYNECIAGIVKLNNTAGNLGFMRSNNYQPVKITYVNGIVTLFINNIQYLTANFPINFAGYMGFTASTGGSTDQHSIRNAIIYTDQAVSDAGTNVQTCNNQSVQIGSANNPNYLYSWSPTTGLNNPTISNPTVTLLNTGSTAITQNYTVTTSFANNPSLCLTTDQVQVIVYPNLQTILNVNICENENYPFDGQNLTTPGTYIDSLQSINGCDSVVILNLAIYPIYSATVSASLCQGNNYVFGSQTLTSSGQYLEVFQSISGCDSTVTLDLVVNPLPIISCPDTVICAGGTAILVPSGSNSFSWQPTIGSASPTGVLTLSPSSTQNLIVTGTDVNGCSISQPVVVSVQAIPNVQLSLSDNEICFGETIIASVSGAASYNWTQPIFVDIALSSQTLTPQTTTILTVTGTDNIGCSSTVNETVIVNTLPILTISPSQSLCSGESALITISGANSYFWSPVGSGSSFSFSPASTTQYTIVGTDNNGCSSTATSIITVHPNPQAGITANPMITTSDSPVIVFSNTSVGSTGYLLTMGDGTTLDDFGSNLQYSYPFSEGNYEVFLSVSNQFGCTDSTTIYIQIKGDEIFYIPNTFTPDGDEFNNIFTPVFTNGFDPANFQMDIYNRWGELIFQSLNAEKGWDGYFNGKLCPVGTYTWKITYKNPEDDAFKLVSGHINLIE